MTRNGLYSSSNGEIATHDLTHIPCLSENDPYSLLRKFLSTHSKKKTLFFQLNNSRKKKAILHTQTYTHIKEEREFYNILVHTAMDEKSHYVASAGLDNQESEWCTSV